MTVRIHPTADISPLAQIGDGTSIWHHAQIREGAQIGNNCIVSKGVYIDEGVVIGNNVKIQNYVSVYHGVVVEDGVFIGPHVCFTNDLLPRAINPDGSFKSAEDWTLSKTLVCRGSSLGANSTIRCGITIGQWAMVGAGSVATKDIPDHGLAWGNPARIKGFICECGGRLAYQSHWGENVNTTCQICSRQTLIPWQIWERIK
ncbi:MAG: transferase [Chloroflexi bacterium RBG_16_52_11]|nr:MAG: transferase [Chloroflexi bacterium RBG_16_52_11]